MKLKKLKIISTISIFILCFINHFGYQIMPNIISSFFFPVNESIYEHMKMIYTSLIIWGIIEYIIINKSKLIVNNLWLNAFMSGCLNIIIYLILYLPLRALFSSSMIFTYITLFISIALTQIISYFILKHNQITTKLTSVALIVTTFIILSYYTYYPLKTDIFYDSKEEVYGIPNKE